MTTFVERKIDVTITLGKGQFGESGGDTVKLSGYRVSCSIQKFGQYHMGRAAIQIFGVSLEKMNKLSTLGGQRLILRANTVVVEVGDDVAGMTKIYQGDIRDAYADFSGMPEVCLSIEALNAMIGDLKPVAPYSFNGSINVATVLSQKAQQMGFTFENKSNVNVQVSHPYYPGTARQQALAAAHEAGINMVMDDNVLAIWPKDGSRNVDAGTIGSDNGLVGYPSYTSTGIFFRTLFSPTLVYGSSVRIKSEIIPATKQWFVYKLTYEMQAQTQNGNWFSDVEAAPPGYVPLG